MEITLPAPGKASARQSEYEVSLTRSHNRRHAPSTGPAGSDVSRPAARRAKARSAQRPETVLAAVDLGTNNCRMLVAHPQEQDFEVVDSFSRITRLGEGLSGTGVLSEAAMQRTIEALQCCVRKMEKCGVTTSRHVATEACRRADNCDEFLDCVEQQTGLELEIISADEEAGLALKGCASLIDPAIPYSIIFDIGGGSTEVLFVRNHADGTKDMDVLGCISMPLGVVTVAEDCGGGDLCERTYEEVAVRVARQLQPFEETHSIAARIAAGEAQMIGTSGTVTTLGGIHLGLPRYDRTAVDGITMEFDTLIRQGRDLCRMSLQQRAAEPCIGWQRADLVLGGCAILEAICRLWPVGHLRVADRGLREGMLMDLLHGVRMDAQAPAI
jgi:exopolyphosphatase/guanosine-5'-triphosphate,3'-diphosphate pyrophosphatase